MNFDTFSFMYTRLTLTPLAVHQNLANDQISVCPHCDNIFTHTEALELPPILRGDDEDIDSQSPSQSRGKGKGKGKGKARDHDAALKAADKIDSKGKDALGWEPKTPYSSWVTQSDWDPNFPLVPSAKTTMVKSLLLNAFREPLKKDQLPDKVHIPSPNLPLSALEYWDLLILRRS